MPQPAVSSPLVFAAIQHVMADMAKSGVGKNKTNTSQNFLYRGVDDVMDALAPSLSKHGLLILPGVLDHNVVPRETRNGGMLLHTLLKIQYEFVCVEDGSTKIVGPIFGEAMDTGDKATNKAMAAAYKYACIQTFCIPITGDDPDASTHEVGAAQGERGQRPEPQRESPSAAASASRSPAPPRPQHQADGLKPDVHRPGGNFGYGKKFYDVPWNVMTSRDLEWFLNAERTPQATREKIIAELTWRDFETAQLEAGEAAERTKRDRETFNDEIP